MGNTKRISFILFFLILSSLGFAQSNFSLGFGAGYGGGIFKNSVETFVNTVQEDNAYLTENKKFSLGGGVKVYANLFYHFQENFGFGLGIINHFNSQVELVEINVVSGIISENTRTLSAKRFSLRPMIQLNTDFDKINTYIRLGISFNITNQKLKESILVDTIIIIKNWEYDGKSKLGFFATWGLSYNFSDKLALDLGLSLEGFQYSPQHNYLQKLTSDGTNKGLADVPEIYRSVDFVDWVSDQYNQYPDPNIPLQLPIQTFSYNNISLLLGLTYRF